MNSDERELWKRAILGGIGATLALTVLMYLAPLAGFPKIDMAASIGGFLDHPALLFSARWWLGLAVFLVAGIVVSPVLFVHLAPWLYGRGWLRGMEWGLLVWVFGGGGVMVYLGLGFHEPFASHPQMSSLASFLGHLVYGAVLGWLAAGQKLQPRVVKQA
jgi:hypothetical protein